MVTKNDLQLFIEKHAKKHGAYRAAKLAFKEFSTPEHADSLLRVLGHEAVYNWYRGLLAAHRSAAITGRSTKGSGYDPAKYSPKPRVPADAYNEAMRARFNVPGYGFKEAGEMTKVDWQRARDGYLQGAADLEGRAKVCDRFVQRLKGNKMTKHQMTAREVHELLRGLD